jgi:hypothetical protein
MNSCVLTWLNCNFCNIRSQIQISSYLNCCISYRINDARRRRLRVGLRARPRVFWRLNTSRRGTNWSPEPKFGSLWHSCPQSHSRRQAPMHIPVFQFITISLIHYIFCITSRSWSETLVAWDLRNPMYCTWVLIV